MAVTGSSRVQIFNPLTNEVHKTLTKFKSAAHGGRFRRDGQLIAVGGDDGAVKIFDIASKTLLRLLSKKREQGKVDKNQLETVSYFDKRSTFLKLSYAKENAQWASQICLVSKSPNSILRASAFD